MKVYVNYIYIFVTIFVLKSENIVRIYVSNFWFLMMFETWICKDRVVNFMF